MTLADYVYSIIDYARDSSDEARGKVEGFTKTDDESSPDYYDKLQVFFQNNPDEKFKGIKEGDPRIWGKLLLRVFEPTQELFQKLKAVSPFAGKTLVHVDYGHRFVKGINFEDLERKIHEKIKQQDYRTLDGDDYLVALDASDSDLQRMVDGAEVVWLYSGRLGQKCPRRVDGSPRE